MTPNWVLKVQGCYWVPDLLSEQSTEHPPQETDLVLYGFFKKSVFSFQKESLVMLLLFFFNVSICLYAFFCFYCPEKKKKSGAGEKEPGKGLFRNTVCGSERCHRLPLQRLTVSLFLCKVCVVLINNLKKNKRGDW